MRTAPVIIIVIKIHLISMEFPDILVELLHFRMSGASTHIIKLIKIIRIVRICRVHVISVEFLMLLLFIMNEPLPGSLPPLREGIFF